MNKEQLFNNSVLNVFQKIDLLNVTAGGTHTRWFTDLNLLQLKMLYKILEDIWNYRAELSSDKKKYSYVWQVEKVQQEGLLKNCWMTTSVSSPEYLGEVI
jgi:hypothetical protein